MKKHPLADCENCPLAEKGAYTPTKFPTQSSTLQLAVVGEAPGFQEAQHGVPFIGPSGKLLNTTLQYHGINREEVILTNAVSCRPPDNETPNGDAIRACSPRLVADLESADRILTLGNTPSQAILQTKQKILSLRVGPRRPGRLVEAEVVPTVHPAYCLRNGDAFADLLGDVGKLVKTLPPWKPPQWDVADTEESALDAIRQLEEIKPPHVVVDIECGIDKDVSFDHPNRYQMLCIGIAYAKGKVLVLGEEALKSKEVVLATKAFLLSTRLIAHNGKFDFGGLYPLMGDLPLWFDTMLAHYVLDERPGGHSLEALGVDLIGAPNWKGEIDKYLGPGRNYADIPRPILYKYNAYDDAVTWDLFEHFEKELEQSVDTDRELIEGFETLRGVHDFLVAASNQLKFLELNGIKVDIPYSNTLSAEYVEILTKMEEELDEFVLADGKSYAPRHEGINPRSPKQIKEYLYDQGVRVKSTDADTLAKVLPRLNKETNVARFISGLLKHRLKSKRHGTYIKGIRSRLYRGRVYTTYLLHGTTSGRLASRNPNLQNIVRDPAIKQQFSVSKPDNIFVAADYKQAEGRVITYEARDEYLRNIFADADRDLFNELGKDLYGKEGLNKDERVRVKAYFYGLGYGREAYSIASEYGIPVHEAEEGVREFKKLIPNVVAWQKATQQSILDGKDLVTAFGRSRRFMLITRENRDDVLKEGLSFVPQSTSSDICLMALIILRPLLRGKAFIRLTIHDALVAECEERYKEEVAALMRKVMIEVATRYTTYVPFDVDVSYGTHWGELS